MTTFTLYSTTLAAPQEGSSAISSANMNTLILIARQIYKICCIFAPLYGGTICRGAFRGAEESPDRAGRPAAESAEGSNFLQSVTENNRRTYSGRLFGAAHTTISWETSVNEPLSARVKTWGKSPRRGPGDGLRVRTPGLQDRIY